MHIVEILKRSTMITSFVFLMMIIVDYLNIITEGKLRGFIKGGRWRQYSMASFLGATPGCLGAFMSVSFYVHGFIGFGSIVAAMIATSGDEAFVMLTLFPRKALILFGVLFMCGIIFARIADFVAEKLKIQPCSECELHEFHPESKSQKFNLRDIMLNIIKPSLLRLSFLVILIVLIIAGLTGFIGPEEGGPMKIIFISLLSLTFIIVAGVSQHYLREHILNHITKRHLWRTFLWILAALLVLEIFIGHWNLEGFIKAHMLWVLLLSGLVGIIPSSGPHMIFVMMFFQGLIPFSVLLTSSFVQDGHGILPLLSYTVRDSVLIKMLNLIFGLSLGTVLYFLGL